VAWKPPKAMHFWKAGFKFVFGRNKQSKVFGIISQLSKSNGVRGQNNVFSST
jgi:hypothetical protein